MSHKELHRKMEEERSNLIPYFHYYTVTRVYFKCLYIFLLILRVMKRVGLGSSVKGTGPRSGSYITAVP